MFNSICYIMEKDTAKRAEIAYWIAIESIIEFLFLFAAVMAAWS